MSSVGWYEFVGIAPIHQEAPPQPAPYLAEVGPHLDLMFDAGIPVSIQQGRGGQRSHLIHRVAGGDDLQAEQIREALEDRANGAARAPGDLRSRGHPGRMFEGQPEVSFDEPLPGPFGTQAPTVDPLPRLTRGFAHGRAAAAKVDLAVVATGAPAAN